MADLGNFNASEVEPNTAFELIPPGWYDAIITASEFKPTSSGNGKYLELTLQILNGTCQNRKTWDRLNLDNPSPTAVKIAKGTLSSICRAVGVLTPQDSAELHNKPLKIQIKHREWNGEMREEVKGYKPRDVAPPQALGGESALANDSPF